MMPKMGRVQSYMDAHGTRIYHDYTVKTYNDFEVKFNTPAPPTVKNLLTKEVHTVTKVWLNTTVALEPTNSHLEQDLAKNAKSQTSFEVQSSNEMVVIEFDPPVRIYDFHDITYVELLY